MAQADPQDDSATGTIVHPRELALSAAWNAALQHDIETSDGRTAHVVFHGSWSHGIGPDFHGAILDFGDSHLVTGDVEIHNLTSQWYTHSHHLDSNYNNVVLHIVHADNAQPVRCANGKTVPTAVLRVPDEALFAIDRNLPRMWAELGGSVCAADLYAKSPHTIRNAIWALGDGRFYGKAASFESDVVEQGVEGVMLRALFGGFGYSANRAPMEHLADLVLLYNITENRRLVTADTPDPWTIGVLLGLGGLLPLAPSDAHAAGILPEDQFRIERSWQESAPGFARDMVPALSWQLARVRPANHPAFRIMQIATLLTKSGGNPTNEILERLRTNDDLVSYLQHQTTRPWHPGLGIGRATAIVASVILPIAHAHAVVTQDTPLEDAAIKQWVELRHVEWTQPGRRALAQVTGGISVRKLGERGHQGLLHLDRELCAPRMCHRCPIAHAVVQDQLR